MEIRVYKINDKFDFGQFKGYTIGIVYLFAPDYIEWCLLNTSMAVAELNELESFQVTSKRRNYPTYVIGVPSINFPQIDAYSTLEEVYRNHAIRDGLEFRFSEDAKSSNDRKIAFWMNRP
ncbi:MAG: hypothetical protein KDB87_20050 [Flavobacteriales bacterium]|nr:hypothetical protein [Flavobacteriales bacterium]MCB0787445.1 hypothetical protein [Flavobacteriales bacterium]MCB0815444.1 hypothetical protein [Flavobacteriales bacterium]MCB9179819.1 hypothetical protein [Flavobacteriales bacterium]